MAYARCQSVQITCMKIHLGSQRLAMSLSTICSPVSFHVAVRIGLGSALLEPPHPFPARVSVSQGHKQSLARLLSAPCSAPAALHLASRRWHWQCKGFRWDSGARRNPPTS